MKIAILSDIHSNLKALNIVVDDLKKEKVDEILFLGDYITDGENENEILKMVKNLTNYVILGNREKYILNYSPERKDYNNYKTIYTTYNNLNKESLDYIKSMPEHYIIKIGNFKVLITHGDKYYKGKENAEIVFNRIIKDFDFDICFFGHTHQYLYRKYQGKIFINPGSIGEPTDSPTYKYCIVEITDEVKVTLKEFAVQDTFNELACEYKMTDYYRNNYVWANLILYIIRDGIDYCNLFLELFNEKVKNLENLDADTFNKIWNDTFGEFREKYALKDL